MFSVDCPFKNYFSVGCALDANFVHTHVDMFRKQFLALELLGCLAVSNLIIFTSVVNRIINAGRNGRVTLHKFMIRAYRCSMCATLVTRTTSRR